MAYDIVEDIVKVKVENVTDAIGQLSESKRWKCDIDIALWDMTKWKMNLWQWTSDTIIFVYSVSLIFITFHLSLSHYQHVLLLSVCITEWHVDKVKLKMKCDKNT